MVQGGRRCRPGAALASAFALLLPASPAQPSQRCDVSAYKLSSPDESFIDNGDGTVTDRRSHLMWMRCSVGQRWSDGACSGAPRETDWPGAVDLTVQLNRRGDYFFNDWRIPRIQELAMIVERQCVEPRINLTVFPNTPAALYWTASPRPGGNEGDAMLVVSFGSAGVQAEGKQLQRNVRLVRNAE